MATLLAVKMPRLSASDPKLTLADAAEWAQWLIREAETSKGVWLTIVKKGGTKPTSLTSEQALDEALCHGWIDGQRHKGDELTYVQRFTPRRPKSLWSKRNIGYIARLESEGRMYPRGKLEVRLWYKIPYQDDMACPTRLSKKYTDSVLKVEKAKADGRWDAAYSQANMEPPADLLAAIVAVPDAQPQWDILTKQNKFAICFRLASLKTEAGRQKRLEAFVDMLARGETIYPQKQSREPITTSNRSAKSKTSIAGTSSTDYPQRESRRLRKSAARSR